MSLNVISYYVIIIVQTFNNVTLNLYKILKY